jgi:hypothetical protein
LEARQVHLQEGRQPIAETGARPETNRILPFGQTLSLFARICEGVQFAHEQGILHRDLKPGNVLLRLDGEPLVADFGLAKLEEENEQSLSVSGHVVGTIENMSPEQAESSKDVDERADVYSLGTILYQMLTGRRHFQTTGNIFADAASLKHHQPVRPRQWNPRIDPDLELIVLKALRPNPVERYRTVSALLADLNRYRRGESVKARPVSVVDLARKVVQKHAPMAAVILLALLTLTFGAVFGVLHLNERRRELEETLLKLEDALETADQQARMAEMARVEAEQQREQAEQRQRLAENALAEARAARRAAEAAEQEKDLARKESAEHLEARIRYEEEARSLLEKLDALEREAAERAQALQAGATPENPFQEEADRQLETARKIFYEELNPMLLRRSPRQRPLAVSLVRGLNAASTALASAPDLIEAWLLKGHFHLALGEDLSASESYAQGAKLLENSPESNAEWAASLREFSEMSALPEDGVLSGPLLSPEILSTMRSRDALVLAELLRQPGRFANRKNLEPGEILLAFRRSNPDFGGHLSWAEGPEGGALFLVQAKGLRDWDSLHKLPVRELFLSEADFFDWTLLGSWDLRKLSLQAARIKEWPPLPEEWVANLTTADLSSTPLPEGIGFLSAASQLENLNLSGTGITDLGEIPGANLQTIDLTGTEVENVLHLMRFPVESAIIDSRMVFRSPSFQFLRGHRSLRFLRTEKDPDGQTVEEFWEKYDAGFYDGSGEETGSSRPGGGAGVP